MPASKPRKRSRSRSNVRRQSKVWLAVGGVVALGIVAGVLSGVALTNNSTPTAAGSLSYTIPPDPTPTALPVLDVQRGTDPLKVLFIGDSLTGSLFASSEARGFRPLMVNAMKASGPVIAVEGHRNGGDTADASKLTNLGSYQNLAIVELGTNDYNVTTIDDFTTDYRAILAQIVSTSPDVRLLCVGSWQQPDRGAAYDAVIKSECEAQGGVYRSIENLQVQESLRGPAGKTGVYGGTSDDFHPNDEGYAAIAKLLLGAIHLS
ncbi:GDSL-type esterase/lipase family protein [Glaciihabitans sp. dw_435]|uniref:SGNH/GDSL hydrolase family protein n=1 Tax=Glaciihabitans sp. dw_435 TaxID=2720081 RepID=UPI001BD3D43E|nr:GDSL-type esterase/lipase family protein [Glaciihabitans sp. dw_435]